MRHNGSNICDSCRGADRVLSIRMRIEFGLRIGIGVPVVHICENCLLMAPEWAKTALQLQPGASNGTLVEAFAEQKKPGPQRAVFVLTDSLRAVYTKWRGVA